MHFVNYFKSKNHKQRYKTKKLLYKAIVKYWKKNNQEQPWDRGCTFWLY